MYYAVFPRAGGVHYTVDTQNGEPLLDGDGLEWREKEGDMIA